MSRPTTRRGSEPAARARPGLARRAPTRPGRPVRAAPTGLRSVLGGQTRVRRGSDCPGWGASRRQARRRPPSAHAHYRRVWEHTCAGRCAPAQCARPGQEQARAARVRGRLRWRARAASPAGVCRRHPSRRVAVPGLDRACRMFSLLRGGSATARAPHAPVRRGGRSGRRGPRALAGSGCPAAGVMSLPLAVEGLALVVGRCRVLEAFALRCALQSAGPNPNPEPSALWSGTRWCCVHTSPAVYIWNHRITAHWAVCARTSQPPYATQGRSHRRGPRRMCTGTVLHCLPSLRGVCACFYAYVLAGAGGSDRFRCHGCMPCASVRAAKPVFCGETEYD